MDAHYEPLPSTPEDGGEAGSGGGGANGGLHWQGGGTGGGPPGPEALLGSEQWQWEAINNLDHFFTRIYRYWEEKGFVVMLTSRVLNLLALAFTVLMSALLLLYVNWGALQDQCLKDDTCDIWEVAIRQHPLTGRWSPWTVLAVSYLALFSAYWVAALAHLVYEVRELAEVKHFCNAKLGISERQMGTVTWPEVAHRLVQVQRTHRLCAARDLSEHDIVARIMRKENYLIGMLNKGVLALNIPIPGLRRHMLLTKTLEWNLHWCVLDAMLDERSFRLKPAFLCNEAALRKRLRLMALANLAAAPFLLVFLIIYFFMKNAEKFYHHPSSIGARRWSPLARWRLREFNELPHFIRHRLNASHQAAEAYIQQFPSLVLSHTARFVAFVAGSIAALLLFVTLIDERLLERDLFGRQIVWWVAVVGMVVALSRAFVIESGAAFDPEQALMEVVAHTHYLPRHWRGRAHTHEVRQEFEALFQFKALLFLEELSSILLTPLLLWFSLPQCAGAVLAFVTDNTVHVEGVGDVCSLASFNFQRHGNARYGSPVDAPKMLRSRQGKMEKSFLSFAAAYPDWEPDNAGQQLLTQLAGAPAAAALAAASLHQPQSLAQSVVLQQQGWPPGWPGAGPGAAGGFMRGGARGAAAAAALRRRGPGFGPPQPLPPGGRVGAPGLGLGPAVKDSGGIFGSAADLSSHDASLAGGPAMLAASLAATPLAGEPGLDRVSASQLLLQSLYEQRRAQQAQQPPAGHQQQHAQHAQQQQQQGGPLPQAGAGMPAPHPILHWPPSPQQQAGAAPGREAGAAANGARPASASLFASPQHRLLQQQPTAAAGSPRQAWLGRSPSGRQRVSEQQLSVLSRENSMAAVGGGGSPAASPGAGALAAQAGAQAAPHSPPLLFPGADDEDEAGLAGLEGSLHEQAADELLLLMGHGSALAAPSAAMAGLPPDASSGGSSDGPPEFF